MLTVDRSLVERCDSTFRQEPRATRSLATGTPLRCIRRVSCHGPRWARYRCARRFTCHQLPDGRHDRGLRASYRFVTIFRIFCVPFMTKPGLSGRTGRAGKQGIAITFLTNDDDEVMCVVLFTLFSPAVRRDGANGRFVCHLSVGMT